MAVSLTHAFTNPQPDDGNVTVVQPSDWNASHNITAATGKLLGTDTSGGTTVGEVTYTATSATLLNQSVLKLSSSNLIHDATGVTPGGGTYSVPPAGGTNQTAQVQILGTNSHLLNLIYHGADQVPARMVIAKSRGAATGTVTVLNTNDVIGEIIFAGADSTPDYEPAAAIRVTAASSVGPDNDMPGHMDFMTTVNGAGASTAKMRVTSEGQILIDSTANWTLVSNRSLATTSTPNLQVNGTGISSSAQGVNRFSNDAASPRVILGKSRGTAVTSFTVVQSGDVLGTVGFNGADGTNMAEGGNIRCEVDGTPGADDMPGRLVLATTADGEQDPTDRFKVDSVGKCVAVTPTGGLGYGTGAGGTVTQGTSRTTGVTLDKVTGAITLFSAAGSATPATFTVTNSAVAATDVIIVNQKSGTDLYNIHVTAVGAGSFNITSYTTGGTTTEQPVFNFAVIKGVTA